MAYIHDNKNGMGRDPLALPWEGNPSVYQTYGPFVGSGLSAKVPPPYKPVGAGELAGFGVSTLVAAAAAIWIGYQVFGTKNR